MPKKTNYTNQSTVVLCSVQDHESQSNITNTSAGDTVKDVTTTSFSQHSVKVEERGDDVKHRWKTTNPLNNPSIQHPDT